MSKAKRNFKPREQKNEHYYQLHEFCRYRHTGRFCQVDDILKRIIDWIK